MSEQELKQRLIEMFNEKGKFHDGRKTMAQLRGFEEVLQDYKYEVQRQPRRRRGEPRNGQPLGMDECRECESYVLVRQEGSFCFYVGLFGRFKIEKDGEIVSGGTAIEYGIMDFNHKTGLAGENK